MTFEESMRKLEELSEKISDETTTLDQAIQFYEEGIACYNHCNYILKNTKQKIEVYSE